MQQQRVFDEEKFMRQKIVATIVAISFLFCLLSACGKDEAKGKVPDAETAETYSAFLVGEGYEAISLQDDLNSAKLEVSSVYVDLNGDGADELLVSIYDSGTVPSRAYYALLGIKDGAVEILMRASHSGGGMGGNSLSVKYDTTAKKGVIVLEDVYKNGLDMNVQSFFVINGDTIYGGDGIKGQYDFGAQFLYINSEVFKENVDSIKKKTTVYVEDGKDFYAYNVDFEYVTESEYNYALSRYVEKKTEFIPVKGTYQDPLGLKS